tara:strand:+ start:722 stop:1201 length:480 start_codon:yes stop_codon:yes gene_type:complete
LDTIDVKLIHPKAQIPTKSTPGSAGYDIYSVNTVIVPPASIDKENQTVEIGRLLVSTGIAISLPKNSVGRIGSRSGLSTKFNIEVGAGWIDSDYRGEILVEIKNFSSKPYEISTGERFAQLVILSLADTKFDLVAEVDFTSRGGKGFGSTESSNDKNAN